MDWFIVSFGFVFLSISAALAFSLDWSSTSTIPYFLAFQVVNVVLSYDITAYAASLLLRKHDLSKLAELKRYPQVALLYVTRDDAIPIALSELKKQTYAEHDIFVLDDSSTAEKQALIDSFGYRVIRRGGHSGYKAGSINFWLSRFGKAYEYFVVLDSDSIVTPSFLESILKYAEHPANRDVAVFETKIVPWNAHRRFPRVISTMAPYRNWILERIANRRNALLSSGHNNLYRISCLIEVGGFDERFLSEDVATTLKLLEHGYLCKYVDIVTYEAEPFHILSYLKRAIRWVNQTIELNQHDWRSLPFAARFEMFMMQYRYLVWFWYMIGLLLSFWSRSSSLSAMHIAFPEILKFWGLSLAPLAFYYLYKLPIVLFLKISLRDYFASVLLGISIGLCLMPILVLEQLKTLLGKAPSRSITEKAEEDLSFISMLFGLRTSILFMLLVLAGLSKDPLSLVFNLMWILLLVSSPFIVCAFHDRQSIDLLGVSGVVGK